MANAAASSSVQAAVVTASSLPVPQNQGLSSLRVLIEQKKLNIYFDDFFFCAALQNWALKLFIDVIFFLLLNSSNLKACCDPSNNTWDG